MRRNRGNLKNVFRSRDSADWPMFPTKSTFLRMDGNGEIMRRWFPLAQKHSLEPRLPTNICIIACLGTLIIMPTGARATDDGIIATLFIGDPFMSPGFPTPALVEDPKIRVTRVVGELAFITKKEMTKAMRVYLPRTKEHLTQNHDLVVLAAIRSDHLSAMFEKWIGDGVLDGDLSLLMADDPVSFGCVDAWEGSGAPGWMETPVGQVLPVDDESRSNYEDIWFKFKPAPEYAEHPYNKGIPWNKVTINAHNRPTARPGAKILMKTSDEVPFGGFAGNVIRDSPVVAIWDIEKGTSMALVYDWGGNGVTEFYRWEYWRDVVARWFYLPAGAEIPTDTQLTHSIRQLIADYGVRKGITISMLEFADMMGANVGKVEEELGLVDEDRRTADQLWIDGDFEECYSTMTSAFEGLELVGIHAVEAKDAALLWIYISEWAVVSGTLCATGGIIWTLMIRRAVYKEVRTTSYREGA